MKPHPSPIRAELQKNISECTTEIVTWVAKANSVQIWIWNLSSVSTNIVEVIHRDAWVRKAVVVVQISWIRGYTRQQRNVFVKANIETCRLILNRDDMMLNNLCDKHVVFLNETQATIQKTSSSHDTFLRLKAKMCLCIQLFRLSLNVWCSKDKNVKRELPQEILKLFYRGFFIRSTWSVSAHNTVRCF